MSKEISFKEYPGLLTLSSIWKFFGYVQIIISIILIFYGLMSMGSSAFGAIDTIYIFGIAVAILFLTIPQFAIAELIKVLIRIEYNTRKESGLISSQESTSNYNPSQESNSDFELSFKEWAKSNPNKTLNDYYLSRGR